MKFSVRDVGAAATIMVLEGDLDVYTSPTLKRQLLALLDRGRWTVIVNLEQVAYIDSTGLGVIISGARHAASVGGSIAVVTRAERMKRLFTSLGLVKAVSLYADEEIALANSVPFFAKPVAIAS